MLVIIDIMYKYTSHRIIEYLFCQSAQINTKVSSGKIVQVANYCLSDTKRQGLYHMCNETFYNGGQGLWRSISIHGEQVSVVKGTEEKC